MFLNPEVAEKQAKNLEKKVLSKWSAEREAMLTELQNTIAATAFDAESLSAAIEPLIAEQKGQILPIFRLALSGTMGGPDVYAIMATLGQEETLLRLNNFVQFCISKA